MAYGLGVVCSVDSETRVFPRNPSHTLSNKGLNMLETTLLSALGEGVIIAIVLAVGLLLLIFMAVSTYNRLVTLRERCDNGFSQIEVQLKRRYDLIPNLVEIAKGYMKHERETLEAVIQARNSAASATTAAAADSGDAAAITALAGAEGVLTQSLGRLFALSESYPDLKANQNMMSLQEELSSTENKVAFARQAFNDVVTSYNIGRAKFPAVILSNMMGFPDRPLLEFEDSKLIQDAPKISF